MPTDSPIASSRICTRSESSTRSWVVVARPSASVDSAAAGGSGGNTAAAEEEEAEADAAVAESPSPPSVALLPP